jgi:N-succinyl-L-ornithine transcarbamylase
MKNFTSVYDIAQLQNTIAKALKIKENPLGNPTKGKGKTIGLVFLIPVSEQD